MPVYFIGGRRIDAATYDQALAQVRREMEREEAEAAAAAAQPAEPAQAVRALADLTRRMDTAEVELAETARLLEEVGSSAVRAENLAEASAERVEAINPAELGKLMAEVVAEGARTRNSAVASTEAIEEMTAMAREEVEGLQALVAADGETATSWREDLAVLLREQVAAAVADGRQSIEETLSGLAQPRGITRIWQEPNELNSFRIEVAQPDGSNAEVFTLDLARGPRGWAGRDGASQPVGGGNSGGTTGAGYSLELPLPAGQEIKLEFRLPGQSIGRSPERSASIVYQLDGDTSGDWQSGTLHVSAVRDLGGSEAFTIGAELAGVNAGRLEWRAVAATNSSGTVDLYATAEKSGVLRARLVDLYQVG